MEPPAGCRSAAAIANLLLALLPLSSAFSLPSLWPRDLDLRASNVGKRAENTTDIPAPLSIAPSQYWDGVDGPWSSFELQIGTPAQNIRVFVSTAQTFTTSIGAEGCTASFGSGCENSRGELFLRNESLTWIPNSIFSLFIENNLDLDTTGFAGFDTVTLGWQGSGAPTEPHSIVFSIAASQYWLGQFGLNPRPTNFTTYVDPQPSFLQQLLSNNSIPSLSYAYTAGNEYRNDGVYGSLTLGGYDQSRFTPTNITFPFGEDITRDLLVNIQAITTDRGSPSNLLPDGSIPALIDSTISTIWLPESACKAFEQAFGLVYNADLNMYLVNNSLHSTLLATDAKVTFTISPNITGGETLDIALPYGAFDLQLNYPLVSNPNTSFYFPLQRASNSTQYTLGRTFLQEAYLIADYGRQNFTVAPCEWNANTIANADLKAILSSNTTLSGSGGSGAGLSGGAIAGVVVGIVALIALLGALVWFMRRRRQTARRRAAELEAKQSSAGADPAGSEDAGSSGEQKPFIARHVGTELGGGEIHELTAPHKPRAAEMESPYKMDPNQHGYSEMAGGGVGEYFGPGKNFAHEMDGGRQPVFEMPGSDVHEMPASTEAARDVKEADAAAEAENRI